MEKIYQIVTVVILINLLTWFVVCREEIFVLNSKCQQIKEVYSNESCAKLDIPQHIRTPKAQICTFKYKFENLKMLRGSVKNKNSENCLFEIELRSAISETPLKVISCHDTEDSHILWPWSTVYLFLTLTKNDMDTSKRFMNFELCASNTNIGIHNMKKYNVTNFSRNNRTKNSIEQKSSYYNETMHKIVSPLAAFLTVGIIACLVFCVRYQGQYGFMRAASQQSINQSSSEVDNVVDTSQPAYSINTSDFMNGIPPYYYYVYQMNKSLHPFPKEPPPSYPEAIAGQTYPEEDPPSYDVALGLIAQQSRINAET